MSYESAIDLFEDVELIEGNHRVTWTWLEEGWYGNYDADDPDDVPLLRFDCYRKVKGEWESMDDASYCTRMPIDCPREYLEKAAKILMGVAQDSEDISMKKRFEELSWFCPEDFEKSEQIA